MSERKWVPTDGTGGLLLADAHHAQAGMAGPFPSVVQKHNQERAAGGRPVLSSSSSEDPFVALQGVTEWPTAVLEVHNVAEEFKSSPTTTHTWLGFVSLADARAYVETYGEWVEIPGPGEGLGEYWDRTVHANPHYAAPITPDAAEA